MSSIPSLPEVAALNERRRRLLGPTYHTFYDRPVHLVRGSGTWLFDVAGERYLDCYNNVASVGHCHPQVVAALSRQAATLNTHTRYLSEPIVDYAERLLRTSHPGLDHALFTCTGSEANDLAIRIARHATGAAGIIATRYAYHGATVATAEISPAAGGTTSVGRANRLVDAPDTYREAGRAAQHFAGNVQRAIDDMRRDGIRPAALIVDTAFSSDGIFFPDPSVLKSAAAVIRGAGGLFIADEVQAGFGRLGGNWWGYQRAGLDPDIVTLGKPMGDGHPVGGALVRAALVEGFSTETGYFNTFGGNPVSAAVGLAVLDVIGQERLLDNAREVGTYLREGVRALASRHPLIGDVRGEGLYVGVDMVREGRWDLPAPVQAKALVDALAARRILINSSGLYGNVLKIRPPLVFSRENADQVVNAIDDVLSAGTLHG